MTVHHLEYSGMQVEDTVLVPTKLERKALMCMY